MRRFIFFAVIVLVLIIGGGLTAQLTSSGGQLGLPFIRNTANPDASALDMTPWKAEQLFLLIGFILFNLIGAALTFAFIFWWLNRQVRRAKASEKRPTAETSPARVEQT